MINVKCKYYAFMGNLPGIKSCGMVNRHKNMSDLDDVVCIANIERKQELGTHNLANMHSLIGCRYRC